MNRAVDGLLTTYESGQISRRDFVAALSALVLAPKSAGAQQPVMRARNLNHVTLMVSDVDRSLRYYENLFGLTVKSVQEGGLNLGVGASFVGIYDASYFNEEPSIHHFCLGIDEFDSSAVQSKLAEQGIDSRLRVQGDASEAYFDDPDGLTVQVQDSGYCGGAGSLGDICE
jgi:catechol 2,3-dioxygenase-like lactoylglutathione lyase family enzyme